MSKIRYYTSFEDDFETTANQDYKIPENYKWVNDNFLFKILSKIIYAVAIVIGFIYCKLFLHIKIIGRDKLKNLKSGFFIYANHTQPFGDVFIPALCVFPKRIYTVVSSANYGIPVVKRFLPYLGALPILETVSGIKKLNKAIEYRINSGKAVVIYPEAHVWKYYTGIRNFADTSFKYPVKLNIPAFSTTVTYRKSKFFKKPLIQVYIDGPFYPQGDTNGEKATNLHNVVYKAACNRAKNSNYDYIKYVKIKR